MGEFDSPAIRQCITDVRYEVVERRAEITIDKDPRPAGLYLVMQV